MAQTDLSARLARGETMLLAGHSLIECYSVLTRMPAPYRVAPETTLRMLRNGVLSRGTVVGIGIESYVGFFERAVLRRVAGGRIYDALIAEAARAAGADVLLTFNVGHFAGMAEGMAIVEPGVLSGP